MCISPLPAGLLNERTFDARGQFDDLFEALLSVRSLNEVQDNKHISIEENRISSQLLVIAQQKIAELSSLPRCAQCSRHIIGTDGEWVGYVLRWERDANSSIHGHPDFAYYQVIDGEFEMDFYKPVSRRAAAYTGTRTLLRGGVVWQQSERGRYDNLVHQVKSSSNAGLTLHLFSEDPGRGTYYEVA